MLVFCGGTFKILKRNLVVVIGSKFILYVPNGALVNIPIQYIIVISNGCLATNLKSDENVVYFWVYACMIFFYLVILRALCIHKAK